MARTGGSQATHAWLTFLATTVLALGAGACGGDANVPDDGATADRPIDSPFDPPIDAPIIDGPDRPIDAALDAAGCGTDVLVQGYYLDWDSTLANPIGIGGSRWSVQGDPTRQTEAAPSGSVSLCIAPGATSRINVSGPQGYVNAIMIADPAVFSVPNTRFIIRGVQSGGPTGAGAQFAEFGATYNAAFAHVLVYNVGAPIPLALSPATNPPQPSYVSGGNFNDVTWTAGGTGKLTLFPNRPVTPNTATLTSTAPFTGPTEIPLTSGAFTLVIIRS